LANAGVHIPIIFITGHGDIPMSVKAMKSGVVEFLTKPFCDQNLLDAINQVSVSCCDEGKPHQPPESSFSADADSKIVDFSSRTILPLTSVFRRLRQNCRYFDITPLGGVQRVAYSRDYGERLVGFVASKMLLIRTGDAPGGYENRRPHHRHNPSH
jgi:Response regulator receiver domain